MPISVEDRKRKRILKDLNKIVGTNLKRDNVGMLNKLSEDFYTDVHLAKECAANNDAAGAEVHRLVAEYLHDTCSTFEVIKE
jgi:hypothetical protein